LKEVFQRILDDFLKIFSFVTYLERTSPDKPKNAVYVAHHKGMLYIDVCRRERKEN